MAQSYENILQDPDIDVRIIEKRIKAFRTIAALDDDDVNELFDTSAFNTIVKGYLILAMENTELTEEQKRPVGSFDRINHISGGTDFRFFCL